MTSASAVVQRLIFGPPICAARLCEYPGKWLDDNLDRIKRSDLNCLG
jgi:hypothetical protein